jgi:hypothetical protein
MLHATPWLPIVKDHRVLIGRIMTTRFACMLIIFAVEEPGCQLDERISEREMIDLTADGSHHAPHTRSGVSRG